MFSDQVTKDIVDLAVQAGKVIMKYYQGEFEITTKLDGSPVTTADFEAHKLIVKHLPKLVPDIEIISEEDENPLREIRGDLYWLIDPLDGTRNFIKGNKNFAVNIGLVRDGQPIFGVIYLPVDQLAYYTSIDVAYKQYADGKIEQISSWYNPQDGVDIVTSRSSEAEQVRDFLEKYNVRHHFVVSSAVKLCMVSEAKANIYPCFSRTMAWDTAAGHAILRAAGGEIFLMNEEEKLVYDKRNMANPNFLAKGCECGRV